MEKDLRQIDHEIEGLADYLNIKVQDDYYKEKIREKARLHAREKAKKSSSSDDLILDEKSEPQRSRKYKLDNKQDELPQEQKDLLETL